MEIAPIPENETTRLAALADYQILDTAAEAIFDSITALASKVCDVPISLITFIDKDRQWFKSSYGAPPEVKDTPRDVSFCSYAILQDELMEVSDLAQDRRFIDNPVASAFNLRFYAGVPLAVDSGVNIGTICLLDTKPKTLTEEQKVFLKNLSNIVVALLKAKKNLSHVTMLGQVLENSFNEIYVFDTVNLRFKYANQWALRNINCTLDDIQSITVDQLFINKSLDEWRNIIQDLMTKHNDLMTIESILCRRDNTQYPVELRLQKTAAEALPSIICIAHDITERKFHEKTLLELNDVLEKRVRDRTEEVAHSLAVIKATLQSTTDAILVVDKNDQLLDSNDKFLNLLNLGAFVSKNELSNALDIFSQKLEEPILLKQKIINLHEQPLTESFAELKFQDGRFFECHSQPLLLNDIIIGRVWCFRDVTDQRNLHVQLIQQMTHDSLTGLPNRLLLEDRIRQSLLFARTKNSIVALMVINIDRFKNINDLHGHEMGDAILKHMAQILKTHTHPSDTIARYHADEFVILLTTFLQLDEIAQFCRPLQKILNQPFDINQQNFILSTSIGISVYPNDTDNPDNLLQYANEAMYRSKQKRSNEFNYFSKDLHLLSQRRLEIEPQLREALAKNEFQLNYQPLLHMKTGVICGVEALVRWQHPILGMVPPLDFIPVAENSGMILALGEWIMYTACKEGAAWHKLGHRIKIAINISSIQFKQHDFYKSTHRILQETQIDPTLVEFELTESVMLDDLTTTILKMHEIIKLGISFAIDDFGTGYSSLSYLKNLPIQKLKIDKSFVDTILADAKNTGIIDAIIAMARTYNMEVLAEGVEDVAQFDYLLKQGCDQLQGYLFSKPLTADNLLQFINDYKVNPHLAFIKPIQQ